MISTESLESEAIANGAGYGAQRVGAFGIHYMNKKSGRFPAQDMRRIVFKESDGLQTWLVCISFSLLGSGKRLHKTIGRNSYAIRCSKAASPDDMANAFIDRLGWRNREIVPRSPKENAVSH